MQHCMYILQLIVEPFDVWLKDCQCQLLIMNMHVYFIEVCIGRVCCVCSFSSCRHFSLKISHVIPMKVSTVAVFIDEWLDKLILHYTGQPLPPVASASLLPLSGTHPSGICACSSSCTFSSSS